MKIIILAAALWLPAAAAQAQATGLGSDDRAAAASRQAASGPVDMPNVTALRANTVPWPTIHLQGYLSVADGGGGDLEYVSSDSTAADNGCTIFVDAAMHRYHREGIGTGMPVEDCGMLVSNGASDNSKALTAAITNGPWTLYMQARGTYSLTGVVMSPPHEFVGGGPDSSRISCSGIPYMYASQLKGTLLETNKVCFQNGVADQGDDKSILRDMNIVATDLTSVIAVAIGDSTTKNLAEGFSCYNSAIKGYVAVYWGNSNFNIVSDCILEGGSGRAPAGEMFERANVTGLFGGAIQSVVHVGGDIFVSQTSTGSAVYEVDRGSLGAIGINQYIGTRIVNAATCVTTVPTKLGGGAQMFTDVGVENCTTILNESAKGSSYWEYPNTEGSNTPAQLVRELGPGSILSIPPYVYSSDSAGLVTAGAAHREFTGTASPNGSVTALETGDVYYRVGSTASPPTNTPCYSTTPDNSHWVNGIGKSC